VPQAALVRYVELGTNSVTTVAGAVPKLVNGDAVAVPPVMMLVPPGAGSPPGSTQVVVNTSCVPVPAVLAFNEMNCPVYGAVSANWRYSCVSVVVNPYQPVVVVNVFGVPVPPILVVPVYAVLAMVCVPNWLPMVMYRSPTNVVARSFHSASPGLPVELLLVSHLIRPPALKKYLAASALAQVMVCVNVIVQAVSPLPVWLVLAVVPENVVVCAPLAEALPRALVMAVTSVAKFAKIAMVLPVVGFERLVMVVPWWLAMDEILLFKVVH